MGDAAQHLKIYQPTLPMRSGYRIPCLNFADARLAVFDLSVAHENLELPHHPSS
jgi:hypothetical protein